MDYLSLVEYLLWGLKIFECGFLRSQASFSFAFLWCAQGAEQKAEKSSREIPSHAINTTRNCRLGFYSNVMNTRISIATMQEETKNIGLVDNFQ